MSTTKLIIRNYKGCINADSTAIIFLQYTHSGKCLLLSSGEKISVDAWDNLRCEAKKSFRGYSTLNMIIQKFKENIDTIAREAKLSGISPTVDYVKAHLREKKQNKVTIPTLFEFIKTYTEEQKTLKSILTIRSYNNTLNHLRAYSDYIEEVFSYNQIDLKFYDSFLTYLFKKKNLSNNGAGNQIKRLKLFMGEAYERGYHQNLTFRSKKFKVLSETADTIYLNEQELALICNHDFSYDKRLERTRDCLIVGTYSGLRYGDLSQLNSANIQNGNIVVNTKKTDERVVIPIHERVKKIIDKYSKETGEPFPKFFKGEQKFNVHLKEVGRIVGLDQPIKVRISRGGKIYQEIHKKYELLSSHCCRRSFATNMYKQGIPSIVIMKITGHKSEKNFMKYIKISHENAADMLKDFWNKQAKQSTIVDSKIGLTEPISLN